MLSGLCGAVAGQLKVDPTVVRMGVVFLTLTSLMLPGVITYLFGWMVTPTDEQLAPCRRLALWFRFGPMDWDRAEAEASRRRLAAAVAADGKQASAKDS